LQRFDLNNQVANSYENTRRPLELEKTAEVPNFMVEHLEVRSTRLRSSVVLDFQRYFSELPFGILEIDALLKKWARKFSVDFATHIPPKIACLIGCLWNTFGIDSSSKSQLFQQLNEMIIKAWLVEMVEVVCVTTGFVYQLSKEER
jgi:hypothetical protein